VWGGPRSVAPATKSIPRPTFAGIYRASHSGTLSISTRAIEPSPSCYSLEEPITVMEPRLILVNLLIKLGVAAAVSSSLVRSKEFKSLLFREERTFRQKVYLALWFSIPIMIGAWIRIVQGSFAASDISFETALLLGVMGGRWAGCLGAVLLSL